MNLVIASIFLFAVLALKPAMIYSTKSSPPSLATNSHHHNMKISRQNKRHAAAAAGDIANEFTPHHPHTAALLNSAKLVLSMESGDKLVRSARGTLSQKGINKSDTNSALTTTADAKVNGGGNGAVGGGSLKRERNFNNKKSNKKTAHDNSSLMSDVTHSHTERRAIDNVYSATVSNHKNQFNTNGSNSRSKQRQLLKSQKHQNRAKYTDNEPHEKQAEKTENSKSSSTCRYAKSVWSDCNPQTNVRTRTLTLKKGEPNCPLNRTMEKKCKKSCRYEKGAWSECINGQMTRDDKLKSTDITNAGDVSNCETIRSIKKKCNPSGDASKQRKERKHKGTRRKQTQ